jgi:hypothetical protein
VATGEGPGAEYFGRSHAAILPILLDGVVLRDAQGRIELHPKPALFESPSSLTRRINPVYRLGLLDVSA